MTDQTENTKGTTLVLLSGRGEEEAQRAERVLQESGADWTIVRCSWFSQNFSESYFLNSILDGTVALPAGDVPEPFVDADDINVGVTDGVQRALGREPRDFREYARDVAATGVWSAR